MKHQVWYVKITEITDERRFEIKKLDKNSIWFYFGVN